jgi:hypothetical protein
LPVRRTLVWIHFSVRKSFIIEIIMAKTQNSKKETKKQPLKTPAEKKAAKRDKKNGR